MSAYDSMFCITQNNVGWKEWNFLCEILFYFMQLKLINTLEIIQKRFGVYFQGDRLAFLGLLCCDVLLKKSDKFRMENENRQYSVFLSEC